MIRREDLRTVRCMDRVWLAFVGLIAACGYPALPSLDDADAAGGMHATDAPPCVPWDALNVSPNLTPCDKSLGDSRDFSLTAGAYTLNTDSGMLSGSMTLQLPGALIAPASGNLVLRVVNVINLSIANGAAVLVIGTYPLVFVVHGDAIIGGVIDVSARVDGTTRTSSARTGSAPRGRTGRRRHSSVHGGDRCRWPAFR